MDFNALQLPDAWFGPGQDLACARAVEAGLYAAHLLELHGPDAELCQIVGLGREAMQQFWAVGLKISMQQARRIAATHDLPPEDLFQDGCVAVAEAIQRYDYTRTVRFTTYVFEFVVRALSEGARHRIGRPAASRADRRAARLAGVERDTQASIGNSIGMTAAAEAAGVSLTAAHRAMVKMVSLDDVMAADPATEASFARVESVGLDFLGLLGPRHRRVLELRFGVVGEALTLADTARRLGASQSTVHRWEHEAIEQARALLDGDRTTGLSERSPHQPRRRSSSAPPSRSRTPRRLAAST
ncbi:sigma-70 family RNA polymerase sigma factor [Tessaracoccus sp. MC1679]|uniref:sigma-70 family RNA polymerase sigma factor n=1 Tax=Tessaracoccus sp. MC1679 TaxID=2760313 RepID=UPI0015FFCCC8|nr:sigma-70 family RNA polymerase sigma factor [Tessaracoccus sp. MC1679]MBB1515952.1 sigma-70 family RNA polymerase sigma factor [Tessaracoccus sp. MC1679]